MKTIRLNRKDNILEVADCSEDIDRLEGTTMIYDVSYIVPCSGSWYVVYNAKGIMVGFVTDVDNVEERW